MAETGPVHLWGYDASATTLRRLPRGHKVFLHFWFPALSAAASTPAGTVTVDSGVPRISWNIPSPVTVDATFHPDGTVSIPDLFVGLCSDVECVYTPETVVYGRGVCQFQPYIPQGILNVRSALSIPHDGKWAVVGHATIRFCIGAPPGVAKFRAIQAVCRPVPGTRHPQKAFLWISETATRRSVVSAPVDIRPDGTVVFPKDLTPLIMAWSLEAMLLVGICTTERAEDGTAKVRFLGKAQIDLQPPPEDMAGTVATFTVSLQAPHGNRWIDVGALQLQAEAASEGEDENGNENGYPPATTRIATEGNIGPSSRGYNGPTPSARPTWGSAVGDPHADPTQQRHQHTTETAWQPASVPLPPQAPPPPAAAVPPRAPPELNR